MEHIWNIRLTFSNLFLVIWLLMVNQSVLSKKHKRQKLTTATTTQPVPNEEYDYEIIDVDEIESEPSRNKPFQISNFNAIKNGRKSVDPEKQKYPKTNHKKKIEQLPNMRIEKSVGKSNDPKSKNYAKYVMSALKNMDPDTRAKIANTFKQSKDINNIKH